MKELYLCFINFVGKDVDGLNRYEFLFTDNIDDFWGTDFEVIPCGLCNALYPNQGSFCKVGVIKTELTLGLIQNSLCFSMQDCMDGAVCLAYEDMGGYDEYPEEGRLILMFGESEDEVKLKLFNKKIEFDENKNEEG